MEDELAEVLINIRACIQSSKDPTPVRFLSRDYDTLAGGEIPYRKFNHPTLESFLRSLDSLQVIGTGRDAAVIARRSAQSGHMKDLIDKTPRAKNKKPYYPTSNQYQPRGRGTYQSRGRGRGHSYPPRGNAYSSRGNSYSSRGSYSTRDYAPSRNNSAQDYSKPQDYSRYSPEPLRGPSNYPTSKSVPAPFAEPIAPGRSNGYDPNDERDPSPEEIVIKVEANQKRQVLWDRNSGTISITVNRNQDTNNSYQRQGFNHYHSKQYY